MEAEILVIAVEGGKVSEVYSGNANEKIIIVDIDNRKIGENSITEFTWPETKYNNKRVSELLEQKKEQADQWDEFIEKYKPIKNHLNPDAPYEGYMYETFGEEYKHIESSSINPKTAIKVWTVCEEDGVTFIQAGWHFVNRRGYIITELPFDNKEEQFII